MLKLHLAIKVPVHNYPWDRGLKRMGRTTAAKRAAKASAELELTAKARRLWLFGYAADEIGPVLGMKPATVRRYASRYKWRRSPEGQARLDDRALRLMIEGRRHGNATRWGKGWPEPQGDAVFVRALLTEALAIVRKVAA